MAIHPIRIFPDAVLSRPCEPVQDFGADLQRLIRDLVDTLNASPGVGLAAPQIGISKRVSVIDASRRKLRKGERPFKHHGLLVIVNPSLVRGWGVQVPREGCLSVPDLLANVERHQSVRVCAQGAGGNPVEIQSEGFEALALQHEIDHLEGRLFLDRVENIKTDIFRRKIS